MASPFQLRPQQFRKIPASRIDPHPQNFRIHTERQQGALTGILAEIGFVGTILVRPHGEDDDGPRYQCLDGHERLSRFAPEDAVPCLVVKMSDEEAAKFLATYDTITGLAQTDIDALMQLTAGLEWEHAVLDDLIAGTLAAAEQLVTDTLSQLDSQADGSAVEGGGEEPQKTQKATQEKAQQQSGGFQWQVLVTCTDAEDRETFLKQQWAAGREAKAVIG